MFIKALFIIARTWKQPICPSTYEWLKKLQYRYTMEYYSAIKRNTFESVLIRWLKLEPIVQSEVSQKKEKDNGADEFICKAAMEKQTQRTDLCTQGERGEVEMYGESIMETYVIAAAAAAKSLQSCPTLCDPIDGSPPGFPVPGILQARTLEWVAISFSNG